MGKSAKMRFGHNLWLGGPIDTRSMRLNCILRDFSGTSHLTIFGVFGRIQSDNLQHPYTSMLEVRQPSTCFCTPSNFVTNTTFQGRQTWLSRTLLWGSFRNSCDVFFWRQEIKKVFFRFYSRAVQSLKCHQISICHCNSELCIGMHLHGA